MGVYMRMLLLAILFVSLSLCAAAAPRDTSPDTWVATDGLGRSVSTGEDVRAVRKDRFVGIFYFLWLGEHGRGGPYDISKILAQDPSAANDPKNPLWGPSMAYHHWSEPLFGYYLSGDPWVLRKHAQMLSDAGVDTVIFDVTNHSIYQNNFMALCKVWAQVRSEGGAAPQIAFLTPFHQPTKVVRQLYDEFYSKGLYKDLWFQWKGKPLIMADPAQVDENVKEFFTFRQPMPSYFDGPSAPDQWSWLEIYPQHAFKNSAGQIEQMSVGIGQNAVAPNRLAAFSEKNTLGRSWHNGATDTRPGAVNLGLNFSEQFEHALEIDPEFIFVTGWNEWIAMNLPSFAGVSEPPTFVDQYTQECSRDIEPMLGGHSDAYYYQLVDYIRRYKGANPAPKAGGAKSITIDGRFDDWKNVQPEYLDDVFDTEHRDHPGWNPETQYTNVTGRNDFVSLKVARDAKNIYFYARTREPITPHTDKHWMMLLIDTDCNPQTGWIGFNFVVNRKVRDRSVTLLEQWGPDGDGDDAPRFGPWGWRSGGGVMYRVDGCEMELAIPRKALGLDSPGPLRFNFKWADNIQSFDPVEFIINGDTAPNGRFAYRYQE